MVNKQNFEKDNYNIRDIDIVKQLVDIGTQDKE